MYNNCNCGRPNNCNSNNTSKSTCNECCVSGIRSALRAVQECVYKFSNVPGFGVQVVLTLTNGIQYPISINSGVQNPIVIEKNVLIYNNQTISLCEIAKIKILTSQVNNASFTACLNAELKEITNTDSGCNCCNKGDYYAITRDDDCNCNYNYKKSSYQNKNKYNQQCKKPCEPKESLDCECKKDIENQINNQMNNGGTNLASVGYNGSLDTVEAISTISIINYANVINSATIGTSSQQVLTNAGITTNTVLAVNSVAGNLENVVDSVDFQSVTVVNGITTTSTTVLSDVATAPINVVDAVNLLAPINPIVSLTPQSANVSGPITITPQNVVTGITPLPSTVVTAINTTTTIVVAPGDLTPVTVLQSLGAPATTSVVGGITAVTAVATTTISHVASFDPTLTPGVLQVVVPAGAFGASIPAAPVTLDVTLNGLGVTIVSFQDIAALTSPATILNISGTPTVQPVVTGFTPTTAQVLGTNAGLSTVTVVDGVNATSVVSNLLTSFTTATINNVAAPSTVVALTSVVPATATITPVGSVTTTVVNSVTGKSTVQAIQTVTPQFEDINEITQVTTTSINELGAVTSTVVVSSVISNPTFINAITAVTLSTTSITVVSGVETKVISVLAPVEEPITGTVGGVGTGLLFVTEPNGDISLYSTCEINTFTSN